MLGFGASGISIGNSVHQGNHLKFQYIKEPERTLSRASGELWVERDERLFPDSEMGLAAYGCGELTDLRADLGFSLELEKLSSKEEVLNFFISESGLHHVGENGQVQKVVVVPRSQRQELLRWPSRESMCGPHKRGNCGGTSRTHIYRIFKRP